MRNILLKKILFVGSYFVAAMLMECITFSVLGLGAFPQYFWVDFAVLLFLCVCLFLVPGFMAQLICIEIFLVVQLVVSMVNATLYVQSGSVFKISMIDLVGEAVGAVTADMINFPLLAGLAIIVAAEGFVLCMVRKIRGGTINHQVIVMLLSVFILSFAGALGVYGGAVSALASASSSDPLYIYKDDGYLWDTQFIPTTAYKKFGTFGFYYKNITNYFDGSDDEAWEELGGVGTLEDSPWSSSLQRYDGYDGIMTGKCDGQNVVLIVIESGEWYAINEYTPTLYAMARQGFSMTNYYSKDRTIHSEALSVLGSYPVEGPNSILPSLSNPDGLLDNTMSFSSANILGAEGYATSYFHANDGDFYRRNLSHGSAYGFANTYFLESMDRLSGFYGKSRWSDFDSDSELISQYMDAFTGNGQAPFFTMLMTLTSHGQYEDLFVYGDYTKELSAEEKENLSAQYVVQNLETYYEIIDALPQRFANPSSYIAFEQYDENGALTPWYLFYKRYQAGIMDLDVGVNRLVHELEERGELDNTLFVFYADHNSFYHDLQYHVRGVEKGSLWDTQLYNVPFFFWSGSCMELQTENIYEGVEYENNDPNIDSVYDGEFYYSIDHRVHNPIGGVTIDKFCNTFDVLPTLLDLLGYEYKLNLYQGYSVFKEPCSIFVSRDSGTLNDFFYMDIDNLYIRASTENGKTVAFDGSVVIEGDTVRVTSQGKTSVYSAADAEWLPEAFDGGKFIRINVSEGSEYLSDSAFHFLTAASDYYKKQAILENMYASDYFSDHPIEDYICKVDKDVG